MELFYKYFDKFTNMIPSNVLQMIRLGALLAWLIGATVVTYLSWNYGEESAPALGQKLFLSNIKEEIAREQNIHSVGDVVSPDLNDLIRERHEDGQRKGQEARALRTESKPSLEPTDSSPIDPQNPVRARNESRQEPSRGPVYHGEDLSRTIGNSTGQMSPDKPAAEKNGQTNGQPKPFPRLRTGSVETNKSPSKAGQNLPFY